MPLVNYMISANFCLHISRFNSIITPFGYSSWKEGVLVQVDSGLVRYKLKIIIIIIITRTASHITKYIHQRDSPPVRLLGGECIIPKSTQYVTVVTDITL